MLRIQSLVGAVVGAALVAGCAADSPADPGDLDLTSLKAEITGAESNGFDGRSFFHLGPVDGQGRAEFTLSSHAVNGAERVYFLLYGESGLPPVGTHPLDLADGFRMFFHRNHADSPDLVAYVADDGELEITHSSRERIEGRFRLTAFRYCLITADERKGPCSPPAAPIPGAPRVEATGTFSAMNVADIPVVEEIRPGTVRFYQDPLVIDVPASVQRGVAISIRVRTYGNGCTSMARTDVRVQDRHVVIAPMNIELTGTACTDQLVSIDHTAEVRFDTPGAVTVEIRGWSEPAGSPVVYQRTVQVL